MSRRIYEYPAAALKQLARHGIQPRPTTPPSLVREYLNDLYRYEIRCLRDRLLKRRFPRSEYAERVTALRRSYWLLSLPIEAWARESGLDAPEAGTFFIVGPNFSPGVRMQPGASSEDPHVPEIRPYGSWRSLITATMVAAGALRLGDVSIHGQDVWWTEGRADEGGRVVLRRRTHEGRIVDVTPPPYNVRTRVHEYGGAPYLIAGDIAWFSNHDDQRLYRAPGHGNGPVEACGTEAGLRFADGVVDERRERLIYVVEDHRDPGCEPVNTIGAIPLNGDGSVALLVGGADFYASPRVSPDGSRLAWISWNHPDMPWDHTELWVADLNGDGSLGERRRVAGGPDESIVQPEWSPAGVLHFVSDRTGWWNLYRWIYPGPGAGARDPGPERASREQGTVESLIDLGVEFARPHWVFGNRTYAFATAERIVCSYGERGLWRLAVLNRVSRVLDRLDLPCTQIDYVSASATHAVFLGGAAAEASSIVSVDLASRALQVLVRSSAVHLESGIVSEPEPVEFPTENGLTAHALFYRPRNPRATAPADELPPLLVLSHGGPTSAATGALNLGIQFWTSRGFAVLDVNYGGSSGYGRPYRDRLRGAWGVVDLDDCINAARYLVAAALVDPNRLAIRGGSAGGYTTLAALTFRNTFKVGASYYGVSDLEVLARDTHKFESRYLDRLIGPYPERRDLYRARSPLHFTDRLTSPIIFFQGLEDKVVPPNQAELMVKALRERGLPVAYVPFEGEQHGFRRAENISRALEAELYFYSRILGFEPADAIEPVAIENSPATRDDSHTG